MIIHCEILGFQIDRENCISSGNHPLCRKCLGTNVPTQVKEMEEPLLLPLDGKRRSRKRCECGRTFIPKSNRQQFCQKCQKGNDTLKNRDYQARFRKKQEVSHGVRV